MFSIFKKISNLFKSFYFNTQFNNKFSNFVIFPLGKKSYHLAKPNNFLEKRLLTTGYEEHITNLIELIIPGVTQNNSSVIDIGANSGIHTVIMAENMSGSGLVYAIEPIDINIKKLTTNITLSSCHNVKIIKAVVGEDNQKKNFYRTEINQFESGISSLYKNTFLEEKIPYIEENIKQICLDDYFKNLQKEISFIKIDTEGNEFNILHGAKEIIKNSFPIIIMEYHHNRIEKNKFYEDVKASLNENYYMYYIDKIKKNKFYQLSPFNLNDKIQGEILLVPKHKYTFFNNVKN
tara:strand:+ start:828 stop:1703 length:876 start_codon:yes stop_codon:yes gene_type:complete